jgi:hypothetical protein
VRSDFAGASPDQRNVAEGLAHRTDGLTIAFAAKRSSDFGGAVTPYVANTLRAAASGGT